MNHTIKPRIQMHALDSSAIAYAGHDQDTRVLRLEYTNHRLYDYYEVPVEVYDALRQAASTGEFVNRHIKPFYDYSEVER